MDIHCELNLDGSLAHLKACLVDKRYSHVYRIDYQDTFRQLQS